MLILNLLKQLVGRLLELFKLKVNVISEDHIVDGWSWIFENALVGEALEDCTVDIFIVQGILQVMKPSPLLFKTYEWISDE